MEYQKLAVLCGSGGKVLEYHGAWTQNHHLRGYRSKAGHFG